MQLQEVLKDLVQLKASDLFIMPGLPPTYHVSQKQIRMDAPAFSPEASKQAISELFALAGKDASSFFANNNHDSDFSFALPGIGRFRANAFRQRGSYAAVVRIIAFGLPNPQEFNILPEVMRVAQLQKGLVLFTGPAGAGKSTTLACIIDQINSTRSGHIITMEDPIEYIHAHKQSIVTQREIPNDIASYAEALRSATREAPDVILLGEMRDAETIGTAVLAAEMGQLLFSTLHTFGAANAVDCIIDAFPAKQQEQIRLQLSMVLQAVISQQLVPAKDGSLVPAFEIMLANAAIRNLIREEKTHQIDSVIASNISAGMRSMDQSLYELVCNGIVAKETAINYSVHREALARRLELC